MIKKCDHLSVIVLNTPGIDHDIFYCEDCDCIIGTSDDFQDVPDVVSDEKIVWIRKPVESVVSNFS
jgi:hypothetical protein